MNQSPDFSSFAVNDGNDHYLYSPFNPNSQAFATTAPLNDCLFNDNNYIAPNEAPFLLSSNHDSVNFKHAAVLNCDQAAVHSLSANDQNSQFVSSTSKTWEGGDAHSSSSVHKQTTKDNYLSLNGSKTKKKKATRKKDVNKPPKPVSAYAHFFREKQTEIKTKNPEASFGEVSKIVASEWDSLPNETKLIYKKKADQEKHDYLRTLATLKANVIAGNVREESSLQNSDVNENNGLHNIATQSQEGSLHTMNTQNAVAASSATNEEDWMDDLVWPTIPDVHGTIPETHDAVPSRCIRLGCVNESCENPQWDNEYCSNDCAVSHCRDVFDAWLASRHSSVRNE